MWVTLTQRRPSRTPYVTPVLGSPTRTAPRSIRMAELAGASFHADGRVTVRLQDGRVADLDAALNPDDPSALTGEELAAARAFVVAAREAGN